LHFDTTQIGEIYVANNSQTGAEGIVLTVNVDYSITGDYEI